MIEQKYWSYKECSKALGVPLGTFFGLVSTKQIPHKRIGPRHVLFNVKEAIAWIESHDVSAGAK